MKSKLLALVVCAVLALPGSAENWLTELPDSRPVRELSIPGTHDSGTSALTGISKCQSKTIAEQWDAGVRAFDIRACWKNNAMKLYHGASATSITVESALRTIADKLDANPGEFAIVFIKEENGANTGWADAMKNIMDGFADYVAPFTPGMTIGDTRGKMLVLARDQFDSAKVPFISPWGDNQKYKTDCKISLGSAVAPVYLQDFYAADNLSEITAAVTDMLDFSTQNHFSPVWVINHTSGYKKGLFGIASDITGNASTQNKAMVDYLNDASKGQGRAGIVMMDYAGDASYGQGLVEALIARNNSVPGLSDSDVTAFFRERSNWMYGDAANSIGTTTQKQAAMIESYREDAFGVGTVMSSSCAGLEDGDYIVTLIAHANWTPGRGSITNRMAPAGGLGYSRLVVNDAVVDLPLVENTGTPAEMHSYMIPVKVSDGSLSIAFENLRQGANWFTCYVQNVARIDGETVVAFQDFESNFIGMTSTTGAQNQTRKGPDASFFPNSNSYENWISSSSPWTGKIYQKFNVPNGQYRINIDLISKTIDGDNTYFYVNDYRTALRSTSPEAYECVVDVTDHTLEFGMGFDSRVANWAGVDNAKVTLIALDESKSNRDLYSDPHHFFAMPAHWTAGEAITGGSIAHKDNLFVESWRTASARPDGVVMSATHGGYTPGDYMVAIYAFSCFTADAEEADGATCFASLRVNGTDVDLPTYNSGAVPAPHELFYVPCTVDESGNLTIDVIGHGYPNWFGIDVAQVLPVDMTVANTLYIPAIETYSQTFGHGKKQFVSQMSTTIQNDVIKSSDSAISPSQPMYENWNGTAYTGRIYSTVYLPAGTYDISLDCFAENIAANLGDYYLFANDVRTPKTQASAFETLTARAMLAAPAANVAPARAPRTGHVDLMKLEYGFGIDAPASQWVAVKNPAIVMQGYTQTGLEELAPESASAADGPVYTVTGVKVAESISALDTLPAGIYISCGRKYVVR